MLMSSLQQHTNHLNWQEWYNILMTMFRIYLIIDTIINVTSTWELLSRPWGTLSHICVGQERGVGSQLIKVYNEWAYKIHIKHKHFAFKLKSLMQKVSHPLVFMRETFSHLRTVPRVPFPLLRIQIPFRFVQSLKHTCSWYPVPMTQGFSDWKYHSIPT